MESTRNPDESWLQVVREAYAQTDGSSQAMARAIRGHLSSRPAGLLVAAAFVEGLTELSRYADEGLAATADAVDLEAEAVAVARRVVRPLLQAKMQARLDALDEQLAGTTRCRECKGPMESQGRRGRSWDGVLGPLALKRRYSACEACAKGRAPAQEALGLRDGDFTPRMEEVCTMMATTVPFGVATDLLAKLCGIEVSVKAAQGMVERRAEEVMAKDHAEAVRCAHLDDKGLPVPKQERPVDAVPVQQVPKVAYLEVDGVVPITREELTGKELSPADRRRQQRAKKNKIRGGKGRRYRIVGREVKNAVLYDGKDCAAQSPGRGCILRKTYVSHLGDWLTFAALLWVAMLRMRFDQARQLVILSDGAEWVRSLAGWLPIDTLLILDLFHVKHRIWEVAHSLYGEHSPQAKQWAHMQCERIEQGEANQVIESLRFLRPSRPETRKLVDELGTYLTHNLDRTDYPAYRARGLRTSSGAVESANYHVTGTRLKLQGMRWSAEGAGHMALLRADLFNGKWEARTKQLLAA
jgi:hypothetical protein